MVMIESGIGNGKTARVTINNNLGVSSTSYTKEHRVSKNDELAFFANTTDAANTLTVAAGTYNMLYLKNTSSIQQIVVSKILSSSSVAGGVVFWTKNPVVGTIGENLTHIPVNLNFSSGKISESLCYTWDETAGVAGITGLSGGTIIKSFITNVGTTIHPIDSSIILSQNDSILISFVSAGAGEFECGIRFYYDVI